MAQLTEVVHRHEELVDALLAVCQLRPEISDEVLVWIRRASHELELGCNRIRIEIDDGREHV